MRRIRFVAILLLISLIIPGLAACAGPALVQPAPTETQPTGDPAHPDLSDGAPDTGRLPQAISDIQREVDPPVTAETLTALAAGNNAFAFDLHRALAAEQGNLFFSPHSITTALAMLYAGARGQTAVQMADVLHYELPPEQLHPAFNALDRQLNQAEDNPFQLSIANSLWGQQDFSFLPEFLDTLARSYGAGVRLVDFTGEEGRENARQAINGWIAEETEGKCAVCRASVGPAWVNGAVHSPPGNSSSQEVNQWYHCEMAAAGP